MVWTSASGVWTGLHHAWTDEAHDGARRDYTRAWALPGDKHNMLRCEPPSNHYILWLSA
jgi:hypothetical protein